MLKRKNSSHSTEKEPAEIDEEESSEDSKETKIPKKKKIEKKEDTTEIKTEWKLTDKRKITISKWKGKTRIDIREYYIKDGEERPGRKGISLTLQEWEIIKDAMPEIDASFDSL